MENLQKLAYCAGLLDGEGSIYLSKSSKSKSKQYKPGLSISMNDVAGLKVFQSIFGGNIRVGNKRIKLNSKKEEFARAYILSYGAKNDIKKILESLLEFLHVKQEQAITMLDYIYYLDIFADLKTDKFRANGIKNNYYIKLKTQKSKNWIY